MRRARPFWKLSRPSHAIERQTAAKNTDTDHGKTPVFVNISKCIRINVDCHEMGTLTISLLCADESGAAAQAGMMRLGGERATSRMEVRQLRGLGLEVGPEDRPLDSQITVEFFADPACPWCYVARQQLQRAVEIVRTSKYDVQVEIKWRPWLAKPSDMPPPGGQLLEHYLEQGTAETAALMHLPGLAEGLAFKQWTWWPNSLQAQRLLVVLAELGSNDQAILGLDLLQRLTFEEGANVSQRRILCAVATELGLEDPVSFFRSTSHHRRLLSLIQESWRDLQSSTSASHRLLAPAFRVSARAFPGMGRIVVPGVKGPEGILSAISEVVLAVRSRQGRPLKPLRARRQRRDSDRQNLKGIGSNNVPNVYSSLEMAA